MPAPHRVTYITVINSEGLIAYVNRVLPGIEIGQVTGSAIADCGPDVRESYRQSLTATESFRARCDVLTPDGLIPFVSNWNPVRLSHDCWTICDSVVSFQGFADLMKPDVDFLTSLAKSGSAAKMSIVSGVPQRSVERTIARICDATQTETTSDLIWRSRLEFSV